LGGFTIFLYGCILFAPGLGGRTGSAIILPFMAVFTFVFVVMINNWLVGIVLVAATVRVAVYLVGEIFFCNSNGCVVTAYKK